MALGLFDVKGFTDLKPIVELGSPCLIKRTSVWAMAKRLLSKQKIIRQRMYMSSRPSLTARHLNNCWLYRDELMQGGKLVFVWAASQIPIGA
jgi:hypothetical protein